LCIILGGFCPHFDEIEFNFLICLYSLFLSAFYRNFLLIFEFYYEPGGAYLIGAEMLAEAQNDAPWQSEYPREREAPRIINGDREVRDMEGEFITPTELARELRIPRNRIYRVLSDRQIPSFRLGRTIRVRRASFESWIQEQEERARVGRESAD
jgi:excisionase family DNA binding protein